MNKICTSLEQSKKLIELGIDADTADMVYLRSYFFEESEEYNLLVGSYYEGYAQKDDGSLVPLFDEHIPAWSLSALLGLMPKLYDEDDLNDGGCQPVLCKGFDNNMWHVVYRSTMYITGWYCEPIDAAFDMVCWLLENKKIQ